MFSKRATTVLLRNKELILVVQPSLPQVVSLSNEYYHLIPKDGYAYERIEPLDTMEKLNTEWRHVDSLLEIELATRMLAGAQYRVKGQN